MIGVGVGLNADSVAAASVTYDEVRATGDAVWWLQTQPDDGGAAVLMRLAAQGVAARVTPPGVTIGTDLHGYGGAAYAVDGGRIWYVDGSEGHVCLQDRDGSRVVVERRDGDEHHR